MKHRCGVEGSETRRKPVWLAHQAQDIVLHHLRGWPWRAPQVGVSHGGRVAPGYMGPSVQDQYEDRSCSGARQGDMPCPRWPFVASTVSERLLGPNGFNGFSPVDARPEAWRAATRGADERCERGAGAREEKRREGRSVAFVPLVDGVPGRALASLGLRGSYRTRGLRPHPISACPVIDVDQLRWIPPPPSPPPDSTEIRRWLGVRYS